MSKKKTILSIYCTVGGVFAVYSWLFGATSHKSFFFNLGRGLVWPAVMFPEFGRLVGGMILVVIIGLILLLVRNPNS